MKRSEARGRKKSPRAAATTPPPPPRPRVNSKEKEKPAAVHGNPQILRTHKMYTGLHKKTRTQELNDAKTWRLKKK